MKMKKMVGALALSAALAMGTAPAFAQGTVDIDGTDNAFSDSGSTEIKAKVDSVDPNVRATVPLQVTVVFGGNPGEQTIMGPSADKYAIENIGDGEIAVVEAELTDVNSMFISDSWSSGDELTDSTIMFFYETAGNMTYLAEGHNLTAGKTGTSGAGRTERDMLRTWGKTAKNFSEETIAAGEKLEITLDGAVYNTAKISQDDLTDTLCKIKYTIAAA